jgi:phosphatidylinositol glycan class M
MERLAARLANNISPWAAVAVAALIRLILLVYGEWQDQTMVVKYTDIDYMVFTDAARFVSEGLPPYERSTYRYTPLLAYLLVPNILIHPFFGKLLFALADIFIGILIYKIMDFIIPPAAAASSSKSPSSVWTTRAQKILCMCIWLFNPFSIIVSTRGNAESLISLLVLGTIYFLFTKQIIAAAILYGLAVHFKIYPIIYALPIFLFLRTQEETKSGRHTKRESEKRNLSKFFMDYFWPNKQQALFSFISAGIFLVITSTMYLVYGYEFLQETYLYHITRTDHRHNFSVYFYHLYLSANQASSLIVGLLAFLPQIILLLSFSFRYAPNGKPSNLCFCLFLQTLAFVAFQKVCTAQYFIWYFSLLPLIIPTTTMNLLEAIVLTCGWIISMALWLQNAYYLEFEGQNTFFQVWLAGIGFFLAHLAILAETIRHHKD